MRRIALYLAVAAIGLALSAPARSSQDPKQDSKDERALSAAVASLDKTGSQPEGQQAIISRLETRFNVDQARIDGLRSQNFGFGEIATILALAEKMQGGINDANVQTILTMRNGPPVVGWGQVAQKLGEKLGPVISQVNEVARAARQTGDKPEHANTTQKPDKPDKPDRPDRPDKPERPDRPDTPERPSKP